MLDGSIKPDWGNKVQRAFMTKISEWDYRLICSTAMSYFRVAIRKHPAADCWSWALEWNKTYRVIGFFGDEAAAQEIICGMPKLQIPAIIESSNRWFGFRADEDLPQSDDLLFKMPAADL